MRLTYIFLSLFLITNVSALLAQTTESDPYAEYSHLWEESTTKKKKKKKSLEPNVTAPNAVNDTIPKNQAPVLADSTQKPSQQLLVADSTLQAPSDTLQQSTEPKSEIQESAPEPTPQSTPIPQEISPQPEVVVSDTVPEPKVEPVIEPAVQEETQPEIQVEEEKIKEPKEKKEKEKKEKKPLSLEPVPADFRGSSGGSSTSSTVNGGLTFTQIDGKYYAGLTLQPEFKIWKIGLGLNVPILYGIEDQSFRTEIFEDGVGFARTITYIRFGVQKQDPVYVRVGELNGISIGFGGLVNNYTNSTSFEKRKLGLHYDVNFKGLIGLEGMYSDFDPTSKNLIVTRPYIRPLGFLSIPIVRTLEIGSTFVSDRDQTQRPISDSTFTTYSLTNGIKATGFDAGINLLRIPFINIDAFFTYGKLKLAQGGLQDSVNSVTIDPATPLGDGYQNGTGSSYGMNFRFNFIADLLSTDIRIERLNYTDHYLPQFFDFSYELNKDGRIWATTSAETKKGIYGSLTGHILQTIQLGGSLMIPDVIGPESPAVVQVNAGAERVADKFSLNALYLKGNLTDLGDAFKLDERSLAKVRVIYHMNKFLAAGLDYYWAFSPNDDGSFTATKYVSPYFGLSIQF